MTLQIRVTPTDPTPPYEQIRRQIAEAADVGFLAPGTRLPTVRQLAADLGIAPGTVMRAYRELEASGHVLTRRGAGTVVDARATRRDPITALDQLAGEFVRRARLTGASSAQILMAVEQEIKRE